MFNKTVKHNDWNYSIRPDSSISLFSCFINTIASDYKACFLVQTIKLNYKIEIFGLTNLFKMTSKLETIYILSRKKSNYRQHKNI